MQLTIPTSEDIRDIVYDVLSDYFSKNPIVQKIEDDEIGGVEFAAKILNKAVPTVYSIINQLPHYKKGKQLYFKKSELVAYINSGKRKTMSEISSDAQNYRSKNNEK